MPMRGDARPMGGAIAGDGERRTRSDSPGQPLPWAMPASGSKTALRGVDVSFFDVDHAGVTHRVQIKRVATARRFTLRVRAATGDAVLTIPPRGSLVRAKVFVERHAGWISARLARLPAPTPFGPGMAVPFHGVSHEIVHRPGARGTVWIEAADGDGGPPRLCVSGEAPFVARRVQDFLIRHARAEIVAAVTRHTAALGVAARRITLRDTTSRWGSCSSRGTLNFSWRVVMAPPHVLDYLAAHEVAHLVHMNHSAAFWATTAKLVPDYRSAEAWLKVHGISLMRYGGA